MCVFQRNSICVCGPDMGGALRAAFRPRECGATAVGAKKVVHVRGAASGACCRVVRRVARVAEWRHWRALHLAQSAGSCSIDSEPGSEGRLGREGLETQVRDSSESAGPYLGCRHGWESVCS